MKNQFSTRLLSLLLTLTMVFGLLVPVSAAGSGSTELKFEKVDEAVDSKLPQSKLDGTEEANDIANGEYKYADDEEVRVSIVLDGETTIEKFGSEDIASNSAAVAYRDELKSEQADVTKAIEAKLNEPLDVQWNLTLAANIISANVLYKQIEDIEKVSGVKKVVIETKYEPMVVDKDEAADPNMATSTIQTGATNAWAAGYTGAGSKVAVVDTGIDYEHQSFSAAAWEHSIEELAAEAGMTVDEYKEKIGVLEKADLTDEVLGQLNVKVNADKAYLNSKIPFAYNYIDKNYTVDHVHDTQGEHGSHVEGIAAANKYIQNDDDTFTAALDSVKVQGVAPDAQIVTMKVFGAGGGAYDSDYMAAIEDAVVLGCDSVNLSLGSGAPGFSRSDEYQNVLDKLAESGTVVSMSAGNSSSWANTSASGIGYPYSDEINFQADGSPGSYTNSLAVASINNAGSTGHFFTVGDTNVFYVETNYTNKSLTTLAGVQDYVILPKGVAGNPEDYEGIDVTGKVVFVQRGGISFYVKGENAVNAGAIATVLYNNAAGTINMDLSDYSKTAPCVSITQADGLAIWKASTKSEGNKYATGTMTVKDSLGSAISSEPASMSDFSSWGVPGSLELKPEITAPGGAIYSVWGANNSSDSKQTGHTAYETMSGTSMASPQVAGMAAVLGQYIRDNKLTEKTGLTQRQLINSLLMSTATPVIDPESGEYYAVMNQGAGLANVGNAVNAQSYVLVKENISGTASDGKVKFELGDDAAKTGTYEAAFSITNFSDADETYDLSADMFTQDMFADGGYTYLGTFTKPLEATTTFTVGDKTVNNVTVKAGEAVEVTVNIALSDKQKAELNKDYPVGAYVEGFVYAKPVNTSDDAVLPTHSIPVLGFYGNWSDAKMIETSTLVEKLYGDTRTPHTGVVQTNYLAVKYPGDKNDTAYTVNPYFIEGKTVADIPYDRAAISTKSTISKYAITLERNAAAAVYFVKNADGEVVYMGGVTNQVTSAYYYTNGGSWQQTGASLTANQKVSALGFKEGDTFTAGIAFIPEYYEDGVFDKDSVKEVLESGKLGEGAYFANTFTVDDTAPEITDIYKNLDGSGSVLISAKDNQYIAYLAVYRGVGSKVIAEGVPHQTNPGESTTVQIDFDSDPGEYIKIVVADYAGNETTYKAYYGGEPEDYSGRMFGFTSGTSRGNGNRWVEADVENLSKTTGLTDYEEVDYDVYAADYIGKYVFFATLDGIYAAPQEGLSETSKVASFDAFDADEYVADMAFNVEDSKLYLLTNHLSDTTRGTISSSNTSNALYTVDYVNGVIEKVADITAKTTSATTLRTLAIDNDGTFYAVNTGSGTNVYLYKWTLDDIKNGVISNLKPASSTMRECDLNNDGKTNADDAQIILDYVSGAIDTIDVEVADYDGDGKVTSYDAYLVLNAKDNSTYLYGSGMYVTSFASMAYDHDKNVLYLVGGYGSKSSNDVDNELWIVDTATGTADHPNTNDAQFYDHTVGVYVVPSNTVSLPKNAAVTKVEINKSELTVLKGSTLTLEAAVYPWLAADKSVKWATSDAETVSVDQNGEIKALKVGTATITATSVADPTKSAECVVTVEKLDNIKVSGLVYGNDSKAYWSEFNTDNTEAWTKVVEGSNYVAGTLHEGEILVHNGTGNAMFGIDPDTFEVTSYGTIASSWQWSDSAASPAVEEGLFGEMIGICMNGTYFEMLNPAEGTLSYFDLSTKGFSEDPLATIAYAGSGTYNYTTFDWSVGLISGDFPANFYYAMTESGKLYKFNVFTYDEGESYSMVMEDIGSTGLELTGVSAVTAGQYASMVYDEATGYLLVSRCLDSETATLFAINPTADELVSAEVGTFGDKVGPVVSLYQYDRPTDLTIKANTAPVTMYVGDTYKVTAKVILGETNELKWTSSAPEVATVENGVITAVGEGTATITMTTVDTNKNGEHVSKTIDVTVKGLVDVNATVKAQATINGTTAWIAIDLNNMSTTKLGNAATEFYGAGYSAGALWGTDIKDADGHIYKIDANTFAESQGRECNASYAIRDVAENPEVQFKLTEADGTVHPATTFGDPLYISNSDGLYELVDYVKGSLSGWKANASYTDLAAISYVGDTTLQDVNKMLRSPITEADADTTCHVYYVVSVDGSVYQFITVPIWDVEAAAGEEVSATLVRGYIGNLGMTFSDTMALSAEYVELADDNYGLIIADATDGSIYYANLAGEEITCGKVGKIDGATNIAGLYNAAASNGTTNVKVVASAVVADSVEQAVETSTVPADVALMSVMDDKEAAAYTADVVEATATVSMSAPLTTSKVNGSLNAVAPQAVGNSTAEADNHEITVLLTEDVAVTNGKYTITYDPAKVTLKNVESTLPYKSFNVDETNGVIVFAFARATAVPAGVTLAAVKFEYGDYVNSDITITVDERGADTSVDEDPVVILVEDEIGEHEWVETKRVEPTCTEDGYIEYTCTKCATTKRTVLKALGHDIKHEAAYESYRVEPTCTEDGYIVYKCTRCEETKTEVLKALGHNFVVEEGYAGLTRNKLVCSRCGLVISGDSPLPVLNPVTRPILNPSKPTTPVTEPKDEEVEEPVAETEEPVVEPVKSELPFTDVTPEDWFYTAVEYLYNEGIMNGTSETEFSPEYELNRATVVTILYRLEGEPEVETAGTFSDVEEGEWYTAAVEWAASVGIVKGYEDGTFAPKKAVTREQLAAIIYRYAEFKGITIAETTAELGEEAVVSDWAKANVEWAVSEGLLVEGENVNATENANRAEVAAMIYTFLTKTSK